MKKTLQLLILPVLILFSIQIQAQSKKAAETIKASDLHKHISYLASDELKGRNTPSAELDLAAEYIAKEFKSYGLKPVNGSYFQVVKWGRDNANKPFNNVVGYIEGSDAELKKELLVVGAHYDHVLFYGKKKPGQDTICNGADDNASGTAGVMEIAQAFSSMKEKPKRSILFIAFGGEEKGLVGSRYYTNNPLFPLENTVAMLNMDMISRNDPDMVHVIAAKKSPDLAKINETENEKVGIKLDYTKDSFIGMSDQASFLAKKIPALFFFTGVNNTLHQPNDEVATIDAQKAEKIARLVFYDALFISNDNKRYDFVN